MNVMQSTITETIKIFGEFFGDEGDIHIGWSPGRVNLIGEHTDYCGGLVLPMAIDLGVCVVLRARENAGLSIYAHIEKTLVDFSLDTAENSIMPLWARYIIGVALLSQERKHDFAGFDVAVHGNLPIGGGVSSSAALCTATSMAIQSSVDTVIPPLETAQLCQVVEHRFAGVQCGIMDQMACRMGRSNSALFIDCNTLESELVSIASGHVEFLIVDSGVSRNLHDSDYNRRAVECREALVLLQNSGIELTSLSELTPESVESAITHLSPLLRCRTRHVVSENARVMAAVRALKENNFIEFGHLLNESHESLRTDFEVSINELDYIIEAAIDTPGVLGAKLTGAGFGGNAIVLCEAGNIDAIEVSLASAFKEHFGRIPETHKITMTNEAAGYQHLLTGQSVSN